MMKQFLDELSLKNTSAVMEVLGIISVYQRFPHAWKLKRSTCTVFLSLYCMEQGIMLRLVILF